VKESGDFQLLFKGDKCSLLIKEAFVEDGGEYKVVAINSAGEASSSCNLTVQGKKFSLQRMWNVACL
jgi:Immunoglobulin I-set domain.